MNEAEKYDADVAALMRSHGDVLRSVVNGKMAEHIAFIVSSKQDEAAQREEAYHSIRVLKDLLTSFENSLFYDDNRRAADKPVTDL